MAKKIRKVYNTKLLYRWSLPLWLTLLFSLVTIAALVVSLFLPVVTFWSDAENKITSMDMAKGMFSQDVTPLTIFLTQVIGPIKAVQEYAMLGMAFEIVFKYVLPGFAALMALFDVILVIFVLVGLLSGRFFHWKGPFTMSLWATIQGVVYFGGLIGLSFYFNAQFPNISGMEAYKLDPLMCYIYLGAMLASTIILGIVYLAGFKGREFIPNKTYLDNYIKQMNFKANEYTPQPIIINNTLPGGQAATTVVKSDGKKVETKYITKVKKIQVSEIDPSTKFISGHAYAKNVNLRVANIPEGVDKIGPAAFANCINLKVVNIPVSVKEIEYNAFFNCKNLEKIAYGGNKDQWREIKRGSNWLSKAGTSVVSCLDGAIQVNPYRK